jgi:hypothetical protein
MSSCLFVAPLDSRLRGNNGAEGVTGSWLSLRTLLGRYSCVGGNLCPLVVIPAQAGIHLPLPVIPAQAGIYVFVPVRRATGFPPARE